jgi:hypothetical protein
VRRASLGRRVGGPAGTYDRYEYLTEKRDALEKLDALVDRILKTIEW